jgi:putative transposase
MVYIITASTLNKIKIFNSDAKKNILQSIIFQTAAELKSIVFAWAIMDNHYHILLELTNGSSLSRLINLIHGRSSRHINILDKIKSRKVWYSYWDTCVRREDDFYIRMNYIHNNPIKHKCIQQYCDLAKYKYTSYPYYRKIKGQEWIDDVFRKYSIIDFVDKNDDY